MLSGKGSKCRVCTHSERVQIESLLARGATIAAIEPFMQNAFSRRALYRHRAKHMLQAVCPARHPVPFPHGHSALKRLRWLQREVEHTAAMAEYRGDLGLKLKALHELGRLLWLERKWDSDAEPPVDVSPGLSAEEDDQYRRFREAQVRREKTLGGHKRLDLMMGIRNGDEV
jgi:hypothetical protein